MQRDSNSLNRKFCRKEHIFVIVMIVLLITSIIITTQSVDYNNTIDVTNLFVTMGTLTFTLLLYCFCITSFTLSKREKNIFEFMVIVFFILALLLLLLCCNMQKQGMPQLTLIINTLFYLCSALYWILFWLYQKGKYSHIFGHKCCSIIYYVFFSIYSLLIILNYFTGFFFTVESDGSFVTHSHLLTDMTSAWFAIYFIIALTTKCDIRTKLTLVSYSFFPMINWLLAFIVPNINFYLDIYSSIGLVLYLIPLYLLFFNIYLKSGQLYLQRESELEKSRADVLTLKINPHFIANTMSSIVALCDTDPPTAGKLAYKFAYYLQNNFADLTDNSLIPFSKELEYIHNYIDIEQMRFSRLKIEYDIRSSNFLIPTLAIQPLVENAVRHGISKKQDVSGTIKIQSFEDDNNYVIRIIDDGVGFSTTTPKDNKKHIGITNSKTRLALLCNGSLTIVSEPKQNTTCEIKIPKGEHK